MCVCIYRIKEFCSILIENEYGAQAGDWTSQFCQDSEKFAVSSQSHDLFFSKISLSLVSPNSKFFLEYQAVQIYHLNKYTVI